MQVWEAVITEGQMEEWNELPAWMQETVTSQARRREIAAHQRLFTCAAKYADMCVPGHFVHKLTFTFPPPVAFISPPLKASPASIQIRALSTLFPASEPGWVLHVLFFFPSLLFMNWEGSPDQIRDGDENHKMRSERKALHWRTMIL